LTLVGHAPATAISTVITPPRGQLSLVGGTPFVVHVNWTDINDGQTPGWVDVNDGQTPGWSGINDQQTPNWFPIAA
jgi:hypothetical protein